MTLLTTEAEIRAAIAMLNPVARTAAQALAHHLLENRLKLRDDEALNKAYLEHIAFAMQQHGWDLKDKERVRKFFEDHGEAVSTLCISIVTFSINQAEHQRKWGWLGKAAAVGAGVLIGSFFG
jgi:hypothetical protein